ncbi:hypothetical protein ACNPQM_21095 [Streptomyces sp. NPDC056231]|uniref:hypothetical protein n=1 Tax=Streptomyces sp. NPDC056231 TaxID=3345755 RepID=UPI003AAEBD7A
MRLPGARIVKAFNTLFAAFIAADPQHEEGRQVVFYAGDDADAKAAVAALLNQFGFAALDLGSLREGGRLMRLDGPLSTALPASGCRLTTQTSVTSGARTPSAHRRSVMSRRVVYTRGGSPAPSCARQGHRPVDAAGSPLNKELRDFRTHIRAGAGARLASRASHCRSRVAKRWLHA